MATNLHFAVCEIYRQAISQRRSRGGSRPPASGGNAVLRPAGAPDCGADPFKFIATEFPK
jgi:hypothetical protein